MDATVKELVKLLEGGNAHAAFEDVTKDLPASLRGETPHGLPYSIWQLVEHIRIVQWDILEFSKDARHKSPKWPDEYWPKEKAPINDAAWEQSLEQIESDRKQFIGLLTAKDADLLAPFAHGDGQSLLREALLIGNHTSYHMGEILVLRRLLGAWKS